MLELSVFKRGGGRLTISAPTCPQIEVTGMLNLMWNWAMMVSAWKALPEQCSTFIMNSVWASFTLTMEFLRVLCSSLAVINIAASWAEVREELNLSTHQALLWLPIFF